MRIRNYLLYLCLGAFGAILSIGSTACFTQASTEETATVSGEVHTHVLSQWTIEETPTCTEAGVLVRACETCSYTETQPIVPVGHIAVTDGAVEATCTTEGKTVGAHCGVCGEVLTAQETIEKETHSYGEAAVVIRATCTTDGVRIENCLQCGFSQYTLLSATGHTVVQDDGIEATCTTEGKTSGTHCDVSGSDFV